MALGSDDVFGGKWALALLLVAALVSCGQTDVEVRIALRTDLVAVEELSEVRVALRADTGPALAREYIVNSTDSFIEGLRVATFTSLETGPRVLEVELRHQDRIIASRPVAIRIREGRQEFSITLSRQCRDVRCDEGEACFAGECAPATCTGQSAEECGTQAQCTEDRDCVAAACALGRCRGGACLFEAGQSCDESEFCNPDEGCVPRAETVSDAAPDTSIADGGPADTSIADSGPADTNVADIGAIDIGPDDTGTIDIGPVDTGAIDTGLVDTGTIDMGLVDTGSADAGVRPVTFGDALGATNLSAFVYPLTVTSGTGRAIGVFTYFSEACFQAQPDITSVTFAGMALSPVVIAANATCPGKSVGLWSLPPGVEPPVGTHDVRIELSDRLNDDGGFQSGAIAVHGVDAVQTFSSTATGGETGADASVLLAASAPTDLVVSGLCSGSAVTGTNGSELWRTDLGFGECYMSGAATAPGGTTTPSWAIQPGPWSMVAASFRAREGMGVTVDSTSRTALGYDVSRLDFDVGIGPAPALAVVTHVSNNCSPGLPLVRSVTFAGQALQRRLRQMHPSCPGMASELWHSTSSAPPPSGLNSVVVELDGHLEAEVLHYYVVAAHGVDQDVIFRDTSAMSGQDAPIALTAPASQANDLIIHSLCNGSRILGSDATDEWLRNVNDGRSCNNVAGGTAPGGTPSVAWNARNDLWIAIAATFQAGQ